MRRGPRSNSCPRSIIRKLVFGRRGVALIISAMMLLMMVVVAGVLFYSYSNRLLGSALGAPGPVTMDNLTIEAYNWQCSTTCNNLVLNIRNIGTNILTISSAQ
ncbi:MAG TPA: hypothetical protein VEI80_01255, partial [Candidatus Acidoferrales bacterium]|nr:hypothetical protein [Candidatus Acidoferrales bacterium]